MEHTYANHLRLWEGSTTLADQELFAWTEESPGSVLTGLHNPIDFAHRLFVHESLNPATPLTRLEEQVEPYSLQWFINIEKQRHSRQGRWIPRLLEFAKHSGETLLGLGHGLGTDWLQYARHGSQVIVCSPSTSQLELIRRNFELRGLGGRFVHARPNCLPLDNASIDVACISSLVQGIDNTKAMVEEVYRVLKPGGKVLAVTRARYDVDFWYRTMFFWYRWLSSRRPAVLSSTVFTNANCGARKCLTCGDSCPCRAWPGSWAASWFSKHLNLLAWPSTLPRPWRPKKETRFPGETGFH